MAKYIDFKKVASSESYIDLSGFREATSEKQRTGCMSVICTNGTKRLKLNRDLYTALGEPSDIKILLAESKIAIISVADDTLGALSVGKGAVIYNTSLVNQIINLIPDVEFPENASTRCGRLEQLQEDQDGNIAAIITL
nr:hypothetical protein [uncultured Ruminococcus sp.]